MVHFLPHNRLEVQDKCFSIHDVRALTSVVSNSVTLWTIARQAPLSLGILQARILESVAMPSSRGSSQPRDRNYVSCIEGRELNPSSISGSGRSTGAGICYPLQYSWASLAAQLVKNGHATRETWVPSLGWEDPLENLYPFH